MTVPKRLSLKHPTLYQSGHDYSQAVEHSRELDDKFSSLYALSKLNVGREWHPRCHGGSRSVRLVEYARTITVDKPYEEYRINSLRQLLYLEVWSMLQDRVMVRKCRHCGKYFVAANRRIAYCDRVDGSGMRCSAIGSQQSFSEKMASDEALL